MFVGLRYGRAGSANALTADPQRVTLALVRKTRIRCHWPGVRPILSSSSLCEDRCRVNHHAARARRIKFVSRSPGGSRALDHSYHEPHWAGHLRLHFASEQEQHQPKDNIYKCDSPGERLTNLILRARAAWWLT